MKIWNDSFAESGHAMAQCHRTYSKKPTNTPPILTFQRGLDNPLSILPFMSLDPIHPCALERTLSTMMSPITRLFKQYIAFSKVMIASESGPTFILSCSGSTSFHQPFVAHRIVSITTPRLNSAPVVSTEIEIRKNNKTFGTYRLGGNVTHEITTIRWTGKCKAACRGNPVWLEMFVDTAARQRRTGALISGNKHPARGMGEDFAKSTRWKAWRERIAGHD